MLYYSLLIIKPYCGLLGGQLILSVNVVVVALPETVCHHVSNVGAVASYDDRAHTNGPV